MTSLTPRLDKVESSQNIIINGAFDFWQRGVGPTAIPSTEYVAGYFLADRFSCRNEVTTAAANSLRSTDVPTFTQAGFDFNYSLEVDITTAKVSLAANDVARMKYIVEGYDAINFIRRGFRLYFWVKTNKTGTFAMNFTNAGASRRYVSTYTVNTADTWEQKYIDIPAETSGTWNKTTGEGLNITWFHAVGSSSHGTPTGDWLNPNNSIPASVVNLYDSTSNYMRITGVALYPGVFNENSQIDFRRAGRTIQDELAMCQRYYEKSYSLDVAPGTNSSSGRVFSAGRVTSASTVDYMTSVFFKVSKRSAPTIVAYRSSAASTTGADSSIGVIAGADFGTNNSPVSTDYFSPFIINQVGLTTGQCHGAFFHFTADADL